MISMRSGLSVVLAVQGGVKNARRQGVKIRMGRGLARFFDLSAAGAAGLACGFAARKLIYQLAAVDWQAQVSLPARNT
jgi:hypothetical protein